MSALDNLRETIDNYSDTVFAILGFVNFYRFDDEAGRLREEVMVFQGRRLDPSPAKATTSDGNSVEFLTPDFGVCDLRGPAVLGDAKKSFPRDEAHWADAFRQLMAYDDDLSGWPCPGERVERHDVVLLTHVTRVVAVCDYYQREADAGNVQFNRPFSIVSFVRSDERQPFFHFEKRLGQLSDQAFNDRLRRGVSVPMSVFVGVYSTVKIYDSEPPLPYMAQLIWEHIVVPRASDDPNFQSLHRNQKLEVKLTVDEITEELSRGFSFQVLCPENTERQPQVPRRAWCIRACEALVAGGMAKWDGDGNKNGLAIYFRKLDDILETMLETCAPAEGGQQGQLVLLEDQESSQPDTPTSDG